MRHGHRHGDVAYGHGPARGAGPRWEAPRKVTLRRHTQLSREAGKGPRLRRSGGPRQARRYGHLKGARGPGRRGPGTLAERVPQHRALWRRRHGRGRHVGCRLCPRLRPCIRPCALGRLVPGRTPIRRPGAGSAAHSGSRRLGRAARRSDLPMTVHLLHARRCPANRGSHLVHRPPPRGGLRRLCARPLCPSRAFLGRRCLTAASAGRGGQPSCGACRGGRHYRRSRGCRRRRRRRRPPPPRF